MSEERTGAGEGADAAWGDAVRADAVREGAPGAALHSEPTLPIELALRLHRAGLPWRPANGDRFLIPDCGLDDDVFIVSPMSIEVRDAPAGQLLTFNGAVEWALDAITTAEVVWLPAEGQVRTLLGDRLRALSRRGDGFVAEVDVDGEPRAFTHPEPAGAYALAALALLEAGHLATVDRSNGRAANVQPDADPAGRPAGGPPGDRR